MNILEYKDNIGKPSPEASQIEAFKKVIERDDDPEKTRAGKELAFVYYYTNWSSPYMKYSKEERKKRLGEDLFEDEEWEPDELVQAAMEKYKELVTDEYTLMLEDAREGVRSMREYFREVDLTKVDVDGKPVYKPSDLRSALKDVAGIMENLDKLQELVKKHQKKEMKTRGDIDVNKYSK